MDAEGAGRRLAAIMFTDIVGYTALMATSEERGLRARKRHRALVGPLVASHRGESIEAKGDESLSVFPNVLDAVRCALEIQDRLREEPDLRLHIGIHLGDVVVRDGEVSGDGVNIASRICALSRGGGIRVSGEVHRAIRNQPDVESVALGEQKLKNVGQPVAVFAVGGPRSLAAVRRRARWETGARRAPVWAGALVVVAAAAGWWMLRGPFAVDASPIRSLAVLPLENLSGDPGQEYFADGMTEEVIVELAKLGALRVISRTSVMQYKRERKPLPEIAQELGVDGIIEGTVTRAGDRVRITAQLIDARNDRHLWSERYDRDLRDVLALRGDIARAVAEQVRLELTPEQQAALAPSRAVDPSAYDAYLRGLEARGPGQGSPQWAPRAIAEFSRSVELDPDFAEAWGALADARQFLGWSLDSRYRGEFAKARQAAERALELDDRIGSAHASLAWVLLGEGWDFEAARRAIERAMEIAPSDPKVLNDSAVYLLAVKRTEEALALMERLQRVAPFDRFYRGLRVRNFYWARQYERALEQLERIRERDPDFVELQVWQLYFTLGRLEDAHRAQLDLYSQCGSPCEWQREAVERGWGEGGWNASIRSLAKVSGEREGLSPFAVAALYSMIEDTDAAFAWLERGYRERDPGMALLNAVPAFDPLHSDPRFRDLVRRVGMPES